MGWLCFGGSPSSQAGLGPDLKATLCQTLEGLLELLIEAHRASESPVLPTWENLELSPSPLYFYLSPSSFQPPELGI